MFSAYRFRVLFFFLSASLLYVTMLHLSFAPRKTNNTREYPIVTMGVTENSFHTVASIVTPKKTNNYMAKKTLKPIKPTRRDSVIIPVDVVHTTPSLSELAHRAEIPLHAVLIVNIPQE